VEAKPQHLERFAVRTGNRISFVLADEVDWIEAVGDYADLHVGKKTPLLRETLNNLEERLDPKKFVRIHRSTIIQVSRIRELQKLPNRDLRLLLVNGVTLKVSVCIVTGWINGYRAIFGETCQLALGRAKRYRPSQLKHGT
jgi:two-component system LytT family response regulator